MHAATWEQKLSWLKLHTPYTARALSRLKARPDCTLTVRFHIDLKMVPLIEALSHKVSLQVFPCHQDTTDPEGWVHLRKETPASLLKEWDPSACLNHLQTGRPFLCDLGGDLICWALQNSVRVVAALEGTTSGISKISRQLEGGATAFPILDWNQARLKQEIHNEKMVGFSLWQTFTEVTRLSLHGKTCGILGFGPVGRGIARTARALGARVGIFDSNPQARILAGFEGFWAPEREQLLAESEVLVTATGARNVLDQEDLTSLPHQAFILNAGHSEEEISENIRASSHRQAVLPHVEKLRVSRDKAVFLLARGRLLNLSAGFGDTINGFDITIAQLVDALEFLFQHGPQCGTVLQSLPDDFFSG